MLTAKDSVMHNVTLWVPYVGSLLSLDHTILVWTGSMLPYMPIDCRHTGLVSIP